MYKKVLAIFLAAATAVSVLTGCGGSPDTGSTETIGTEAASAAAITSGAEASSDGSGASGGTVDLVYGIKSGWNTLFTYAVNTTNGWMLQDVMFEVLLKPGDGEVYMRAAESIDVSDDYLTWTIHLRDNLTWHDGEPCTAEDWVWTLETVTNPEFGVYEGLTALNIVKGTTDIGQLADGETLGISYVDDYTFTLEWKEPPSLIPLHISRSMMPMLPMPT